MTRDINSLFDAPEKTEPGIRLSAIADKKILLYGFGNGGKTFLKRFHKKERLNICAVLDMKFETPDSLNGGIKACSPFDYEATKGDREDAIVIITVGGMEHQKEIRAILARKGFKNVMHIFDFYEHQNIYENPDIKLYGLDYFIEKKTDIIKAYGLLADDLSREVFYYFLKTHLTQSPQPVPFMDATDRYFPKDIALKKGYSRVIDCGAYRGDTVEKINKRYGKIKALACFEPDLENYRALSQFISNNCKEIADEISLFPCGVLERLHRVKFASGFDTEGHVSISGEEAIQCVAIDEALPGFSPSFICMNVEGSEVAALRGAIITLVDYKPDLAISAYHLSNHIWEIPLLLDVLDLGYKFYLRNHTASIIDTVLYAAAE